MISGMNNILFTNITFTGISLSLKSNGDFQMISTSIKTNVPNSQNGISLIAAGNI